MNDVSDLSNTIKPKSDQLNADDLLTGPITVTITDVKGGTVEQPVHIYIEGQQPYKPCKGMRRVLINAWGINGKEWVGKSMTLFCNPLVKWAGVALGGIEISHLTDITKPSVMMLTKARGRKAEFTVQPLIIENIDLEAVAKECGYTVQEVCQTFTPELDSIDEVQDEAGCAAYLRNNRK